jgi:hypothetical protein
MTSGASDAQFGCRLERARDLGRSSADASAALET